MTNYEKLMQIMPKGTLAHLLVEKGTYDDGDYVLVASACPDRSDLLVPGPLVRDSEGKVIGCRGLSII